MKRLRDKLAVNIRYWSPEMLDAYRKARAGVAAEESKAIAKIRKVYAPYSRFSEEYKLWADNGYLNR